MHGEVKADFSIMPKENIIILLAGIAVLLIITAVVIVVVVRKLGIKSFGPFKAEHDNTTALYDMNEKTKDLDDLCRRQMRYITDKIKIHISNIFAEMDVCVPTRVAISSAIRFPLFESIANNHFTTELMPERYAAYRERIVENMKDEYVSLATATKNNQCSREALPSWEQMSDKLTGCIDQWLKRISKEVMDTCNKKIAVYSSFLRNFEQSKDEFRSGIVKMCVEKNERYIRELKRLI